MQSLSDIAYMQLHIKTSSFVMQKAMFWMVVCHLLGCDWTSFGK